MLQAMYNGVSGLDVEQTWMDTIGNNIANVNTTGYKAQDVNFEDQLSDLLAGATAPAANTGGVDPTQTGLGVKVASISTDNSQGSLEQTNTPTNLAISGNGYFLVGNGGATGSVDYTRDGSFTLDANGNLVDSSTGQYVLGWQAGADGTINNQTPITAASDLTIQVGRSEQGVATSTITLGGNLSSDATGEGPYSQSLTYYDSHGASHNVTANFYDIGATPPPATVVTDGLGTSGNGSLTAGSTYDVEYTYVYPDGLESAPSVSQSVTLGSKDTGFNFTPPTTAPQGATGINVYLKTSAGTTYTLSSSSSPTIDLTSSTPPTFPVDVNTDAGNANPPTVSANSWGYDIVDPSNSNTSIGTGTVTFGTNGAETASTGQIAVGSQNIALDFSAVTNDSGASSVVMDNQNGAPPGTLQSFSIGETGVIVGAYSNGQTGNLGQIAMANFTNASGLARDGNNEYSPSANSGAAQVGTSSSDGLGTINSGYLEQSNVDISNEFTNMIISQRGFEANTKIVTTVDTLLSDVLGMIQG